MKRKDPCGKMISMDDFREKMIKELKSAYGNEYEVAPIEVMRNNGVRRCGVSVGRTGTSLAPVVYLEDSYSKYQDGVRIEDIISDIQDMLAQEASRPHQIKELLCGLDDFNEVREHLRCRLINCAANEEALQSQVYRKICDLAIVVDILIFSDGNGSMTIRVQKRMAETWGISEEDLINIALENGQKNNPAQFSDMASLLGMKGKEHPEEQKSIREQLRTTEDERVNLHVLTVKDGTLGAIAMMYPGCLETVTEKLDSDLLILPSSIHEVLILPCPQWDDLDSFREMVYEINRQYVAEEERLSDQVYMFYRDSRMLKVA